MQASTGIHWQIEGPLAAKKTFLLLHGIAGSHKLWGPLPHLLAAAGYRVLAPDLPGFGDSNPVDYNEEILPASVAKLAEDLPTLTDQEVIVIGHSYGGGIAALFAHTHPELVKGLVLIAPGGFFLRQLPGKPAWRFPELQFIQRLGALAAGPVLARTAILRRLVLNRFVHRHWQVSSQQLGALIQDVARAKSTGRAGMAIIYADLWQYTETMETPTWLIHGEKDQIINVRCTQKLSNELPNCIATWVYSNVGHLPQFEDPTRLVQDLQTIAAHFDS